LSESVPLGTDSEATFFVLKPTWKYPSVVTLRLRGEVFMCASQEADETKNYQEAIKSLTSKEWKLTMQEMESMRKNQV